ncbi:class I adenylate-forming enzyme family protein [Rhodococcus opacus]|nr:fatty acid--CoA ligase family protein [Rhodococcus opacus]
MDVSTRIRNVMALDHGAQVVEYEGRWLTWGQIDLVSEAVANAAKDLPANSAIVVITKNHPATVASILSLLSQRRACATVNGMHPDAAVIEEIEKIQPAIVIAGESDWQRQGLMGAVSSVGALGLLIDDEVASVTECVGAREGVEQGVVADGTAISLQTSGTTGPPKRIAMTYANIDASVTGVLAHYGSGSGVEPELKLRPGVAVQMLPLGHTSALLSLCVMAVEGRKMVLLDRFEPWAWANAIKKHSIAVSGMPPAALRMVLDAEIPRDHLESLRAVRAGTAPLPQSLADEFTERYDIPVIQAYGATEFQGVASWTLRDHKKFGSNKRGSVGRAHPGVELRVIDTKTAKDDLTPNILGENKTGLLEVRSAQASGHGVEDWVRTSDLARIDCDGFLYIEGRVDDVINRGGFKVDAQEVADLLKTHETVADAVVVGAPDPRLGSVPVALVTAATGSTPTEADLKAFVRSHLEPYKVPAKIVIVDKLPRNATMKVGVRDVLELIGWDEG